MLEEFSKTLRDKPEVEVNGLMMRLILDEIISEINSIKSQMERIAKRVEGE